MALLCSYDTKYKARYLIRVSSPCSLIITKVDCPTYYELSLLPKVFSCVISFLPEISQNYSKARGKELLLTLHIPLLKVAWELLLRRKYRASMAIYGHSFRLC